MVSVLPGARLIPPLARQDVRLMYLIVLCRSNLICVVLHQASLERVGIDPTAAVGRARERARSRVGRKRTRSEAEPSTAQSMDITAAAPEKKRVHSSKSRCLYCSSSLTEWTML